MQLLRSIGIYYMPMVAHYNTNSIKCLQRNFLCFQVCNTISLLHLGYIDKSKYKVSINLTGLDKIAKFDSVILEVSYNMYFVFDINNRAC